ncbi:MAG: PKD domain-containing protein, partial [Flavobacteriales bacterium]|nr:PKD domain-containing protein [Flavobacteriales bacterium]
MAICLAQTVLSQCEVDAGDDISICAGETITLGGSPTVVEGNNPVINWDNVLGNGTNPTVTPASTTTYTVQLSADGGCNTSDEITVTVLPGPTADFSFNPNNNCAGTTVVFVNESSGTDLSYSWDFDNPLSGNNSSSSANTSHEFLAYGNGTATFDVTLTVTDGNGCTDTHTEQVSVTESPDPTITDQDIFSPFVDCGPPGTSFEITVNNSSTTQATNTNYTIDWGDGSPVFSDASFTTLTHPYAESGFFTIEVIVDGQNGCSTTEEFEVFFGNNPSVALGGGNTIGLCAPTETLFFPILNTENNPPGTIYTVSYNDGSPNEVFTHPPPAAVEHVFNGSSCGVTSLGGFANSFHVRIIAENPCGQSSSTFEPVQTSSPPSASMAVSPGTEWCSNQNSFTFSNTSTDAFFNNNGVCTSLMVAEWEIEPATGWIVTGGTLNDANGFSASFDPGTYTVTMTAGNPCGDDVVSMEICATPPPEALFDLNTNSGCAPLTLNTENFSSSLQLCDNETYFWEVFPNNGIGFSNGSNTSIDPDITFSQEGTYTLQLSVTNACGTDVYSETVSVIEQPTVDVSDIFDFCENASINPSAFIDNGGGTISDYSWTFPGGTPASSNTQNPGTITFNNDGSFTATLSVTNECGTVTSSESF